MRAHRLRSTRGSPSRPSRSIPAPGAEEGLPNNPRRLTRAAGPLKCVAWFRPRREEARMAGSGDWLVAEELFAGGDPGFVDEVRRVDDAAALAAFAARWVDDRRPEARAMLLEYLDRPLNSYRHEALVKR